MPCVHLPWVLLGLRAAPKEEPAVSIAELVTGSPLIIPGQLLRRAGSSTCRRAFTTQEAT
jgi:hypothetical protein